MLQGRLYTAATLPAALAEAVDRYTRRHGQPPARLWVRSGSGAPAAWAGVPVAEQRHVPAGACVAEGAEA